MALRRLISSSNELKVAAEIADTLPPGSLPPQALRRARLQADRMNDQTELPGEATDFKKLPMLGYHEERRSYPRIDLSVPVMISTEDCQVLHGRVRTISTDGLQIRCDRRTAQAIHPRGTHIAPGSGPKVTLRFELSLAAPPALAFAAVAQLTYITPRSQDEIAFGVKFTRIARPDKAVLAAFIMDALRPHEP